MAAKYLQSTLYNRVSYNENIVVTCSVNIVNIPDISQKFFQT